MRLLKVFIVASFVFLHYKSQSFAQSNTVTSGGVASGSNGTSSYSVGQPFYISSIGVNGKVIQGVQQPYEISVITGINDLQINLKATVYPNPSADYVTLSIDNPEINQLSYQLLDIQGRVIRHEKFRKSNVNIKMTSLNSGIYFLKVLSKQRQLKTFKIIKAQ